MGHGVRNLGIRRWKLENSKGYRETTRSPKDWQDFESLTAVKRRGGCQSGTAAQNKLPPRRRHHSTHQNDWQAWPFAPSKARQAHCGLSRHRRAAHQASGTRTAPRTNCSLWRLAGAANLPPTAFRHGNQFAAAFRHGHLIWRPQTQPHIFRQSASPAARSTCRNLISGNIWQYRRTRSRTALRPAHHRRQKLQGLETAPRHAHHFSPQRQSDAELILLSQPPGSGQPWNQNLIGGGRKIGRKKHGTGQHLAQAKLQREKETIASLPILETFGLISLSLPQGAMNRGVLLVAAVGVCKICSFAPAQDPWEQILQFACGK